MHTSQKSHVFCAAKCYQYVQDSCKVPIKLKSECPFTWWTEGWLECCHPRLLEKASEKPSGTQITPSVPATLVYTWQITRQIFNRYPSPAAPRCVHSVMQNIKATGFSFQMQTSNTRLLLIQLIKSQTQCAFFLQTQKAALAMRR